MSGRLGSNPYSLKVPLFIDDDFDLIRFSVLYVVARKTEIGSGVFNLLFFPGWGSLFG